MGSEAPRVSSRNFPDADQVGIASGVTLNQSRVTFSGARGQVKVRWTVRFENAGAVAIAEAALQATVGSTAPILIGPQEVHSFEAVVGRRDTIAFTATYVDPPAGSFTELRTFLSAGTVTILTNTGAFVAESWAPGVDQGPIVTVQ